MWFSGEMQRTAPQSAGARAILPFNEWVEDHWIRQSPEPIIEKKNQYSVTLSVGVRKSAMMKSSFTSPAPKPYFRYAIRESEVTIDA